MDSKKIFSLIQKPRLISSSDISELDKLLAEHPYFQTGQLLLAKGLLNIKSVRYNRQLKKAASYSIDRQKLFNLITLDKNQEERTEPYKEDREIEQSLKIGTPLEFHEDEMHSFSEWLVLSNIKKIDRNKDPKRKNLIDNFIDRNISISKPKKERFFKPVDIAKESLIENDNLVTPTLARVYLEQGHYNKAILAYNKLILKYPEKSSFFADQIQLINKLNNK
ncbi:MAG: hypothetical protein CMD16_02670 [Flavobacteriales bacterium]|nr:hypothetical protein [Flavobacteriales bacterium]|tara:strand:- start:39538 stop:40203 length:666 start_codon:yes stop_codon:yes gene_type:complete